MIDSQSTNETNEWARMVFDSLRRITHAVDQHSRSMMARHGLTRPQLLILRELDLAEGLTVGQLTRSAQLSQATVTGIVDRLERQNLVHRVRNSADRRCVELYLTQAGREMLAKAPGLLQDEFVEAFECLPQWEQMQIASVFQRVAEMMQKKTEIPGQGGPGAYHSHVDFPLRSSDGSAPEVQYAPGMSPYAPEKPNDGR